MRRKTEEQRLEEIAKAARSVARRSRALRLVPRAMAERARYLALDFEELSYQSKSFTARPSPKEDETP